MAPEAQADRQLYRSAIQALLGEQTGVSLIEAAVGDLHIEAGHCRGIVTEAGDIIRAGAVVLTTGTFLDGLIHLGAEKTPAGRIGNRPLGPWPPGYGARFACGPPENRNPTSSGRPNHCLGLGGNAASR